MFDQILTPFRTYICTCIDVNIANQDYSTKIFNKIIITIGISTSITLVVYSFEGDTILQRKRKKSRELEQGPRPVVLVLKTKKHNKTCKSKGFLGPFDYNIVFNVRIYIHKQQQQQQQQQQNTPKAKRRSIYIFRPSTMV